MEEKDAYIIRLQNDIKAKNEYIGDLTEEIDNKNFKVMELQS